ncbi:MAG: type II toxin-antitoxin system VapB family antitoxin [Thermodesulfobacteriota bacterium]
MKITINIDEKLINEASEIIGIEDKSSIIEEALKTLIRIEATKRLSKLSGTQKNVEDIPRRR